MAKQALISKHIVLSDLQPSTEKKIRYPTSGILLIEGSQIKEVILSDESVPISSLLSKYSEWNPIDYSDYYISPGIIDINTRLEWDSFERLTKEAIKGGITYVLTEPGYYQPLPEPSHLFCDVSYTEVINDSVHLENLSKDVLAVKVYLYPPGPNVPSVANLQRIIEISQNQVSLIIDPTLPEPRMLYMASPHRFDELNHRNSEESSKEQSNLTFAAAFPEALDKSGSENESSSEEEPLPPPLKSTSLQYGQVTFQVTHKKTISSEKVGEDLGKYIPESVIKEEDEIDATPGGISGLISNFTSFANSRKRGSYDIYSDLDLRIKASTQKIEDLCLAEKDTYKHSGPTQFLLSENDSVVKSSSLSSISHVFVDPSVIEEIKAPEPPVRKFRPAPIQIKSAPKPNTASDYNYYLANYPEYWESSGIEKILEYMKTDYKVHVANVSSASALNRIRRCKHKFRGLTCEISATNLCFNSSLIKPADTRFKNTPPLRNQGNCNLLWDLLKMKGIDCITSQHASISPELKLNGDFKVALNGISSIGCGLQSVWNIFNIPVSTYEQLEHYIVRLAKWFSLHPAMVLGVNDKRGSIDKGKFADLIVWKPHEKVSLEHNYAYSETSPFIGIEAMGKIERVYVRGKVGFDRGLCFEVGEKIKRE